MIRRPAPDTMGGADNWRRDAACIDQDPELWFPPVLDSGGRIPADHPGIAAARAVCARCPVAEQCLSWAVATAQDHGIWAGTLPSQRRAMRAAETHPCEVCEAETPAGARHCSRACQQAADRTRRSRGEPVTRRPVTAGEITTVRTLAAAGHTDRDIAAQLGRQVDRIRRIRWSAQIPAGRPRQVAGA